MILAKQSANNYHNVPVLITLITISSLGSTDLLASNFVASFVSLQGTISSLNQTVTILVYFSILKEWDILKNGAILF